MYEMLSGQVPFGGDTAADVIARLIHDDPAGARRSDRTREEPAPSSKPLSLDVSCDGFEVKRLTFAIYQVGGGQVAWSGTALTPRF